MAAGRGAEAYHPADQRLELLIIPTYRETIHYLEGALEEREREGLFHLKRVKARKGKGRSVVSSQ